MTTTTTNDFGVCVSVASVAPAPTTTRRGRRRTKEKMTSQRTIQSKFGIFTPDIHMYHTYITQASELKAVGWAFCSQSFSAPFLAFCCMMPFMIKGHKAKCKQIDVLYGLEEECSATQCYKSCSSLNIIIFIYSRIIEI